MIRSPMISHVVSFGGALLAAAIVALTFPNWHGPWTRFVAAYDVFALCLLAWYWLIALQRDAMGAGRRGAMEDPGRNVVVVVVVHRLLLDSERRSRSWPAARSKAIRIERSCM